MKITKKKSTPMTEEAYALDCYRQTLPYFDACDPRTLGNVKARVYLTNRIEAAFLEGIRQGVNIAVGRITRRIQEISKGAKL